MKPSHKLAIALIAGMLAIWATCALGFWQLRRAAGKEALQAQADATARATPAEPDATALRDPAALVSHHLRLRGEWVPEQVVYLDNRPQNGQPGFYVLMPLRIAGPSPAEIVVNRGWTPRAMDDRTRIAPYATPAGTVEITGVALADEPRLLELATPAARRLRTIWQNFDFAAFSRASGQTPLPLVLRQDAEATSANAGTSRPSSDGLIRDWPDRGGVLQGQIDRHHGYAFQWFALAATFAALLIFRVVRVIQHARLRPDSRVSLDPSVL
jgi:cytochrome oxidase assembly protein ShyY1